MPEGFTSFAKTATGLSDVHFLWSQIVDPKHEVHAHAPAWWGQCFVSVDARMGIRLVRGYAEAGDALLRTKMTNPRLPFRLWTTCGKYITRVGPIV